MFISAAVVWHAFFFHDVSICAVYIAVSLTRTRCSILSFDQISAADNTSVFHALGIELVHCWVISICHMLCVWSRYWVLLCLYNWPLTCREIFLFFDKNVLLQLEDCWWHFIAVVHGNAYDLFRWDQVHVSQTGGGDSVHCEANRGWQHALWRQVHYISNRGWQHTDMCFPWTQSNNDSCWLWSILTGKNILRDSLCSESITSEALLIFTRAEAVMVLAAVHITWCLFDKLLRYFSLLFSCFCC